MARRQEAPKPLFPLKHEFVASLDQYIHKAGMLGDAVRTIVAHADDFKVPEKVVGVLRERLVEFDLACSGEAS
jgi:hypothetical protein